MLHGWRKTLQILRPMAEMLSHRCRVILIDLPGFGSSPLPPEASNEGGGWGTQDYALRVKSFLDTNGVDSCVFLGHSFGGRISVRLAAQYPGLAKGLVLVGTPGVPRLRTPLERLSVASIKTLGSLAKRVDGALGTRLFAHYFAPRFGSADYKSSGDMRKTFVKIVNEDLSELAKTIACPTLLLWGAQDREAPVDQAHTYHGLIANSELHVFPHKGHEPYSDSGAHLMTSYIESFLTTQGLLI